MTVAAVSGVNSNTTAATRTTGASNASVDYDTFLKLLVAQLKNQDSDGAGGFHPVHGAARQLLARWSRASS